MSKLDFSYLIAPHTAAEFFERYWQKSSLLIKRAEAGRFQGLLPATDVGDVLSMAEQLPAEAVELVGRALAIKHDSGTSPALAEFFMNGSTIRVRGAERYWEPLGKLCRSIEQELRFPTRANLYCTPAGARGFDLHFDTHEVLVLQLLGRKRWQVFEPIVKLPLEHAPTLRFEDDREALRRSRGGRENGHDSLSQTELGAASLDTALEPGDGLYLPRGFVHQAESLDEPSVHLTIGIHVLTWLDLLSVALSQSAWKNEALRQALPVGSLEDPETRKRLGREFAQRVQLFSQEVDFDCALDELNASFTRSRSVEPKTIGPDSLPLETKLAGSGQLEVYVSADRTMAGLGRGQEIFWMPACFAAAFRFVVERKEFYPGELPGRISDNGKLSLVRRLVQDGFLRVAD